jgi:uncharacterized CHY-type Zn-finger protein
MGGVFYQEKNTKFTKLNLMVVRVNKLGDICNARPCYNCLDMMKAVGIRKVYYSISSDNIICEKVKDMISIQASLVDKQVDDIKSSYNNNFKSPIYDTNKYYEKLLIKNFPKTIRQSNLDNFIIHNLVNVLPAYKVIIYNTLLSSYAKYNDNTVLSSYAKHNDNSLRKQNLSNTYECPYVIIFDNNNNIIVTANIIQ